jgi:hypothetical protein
MDLDGIFQEVNVGLGKGEVSAEFYPYRELKHTWKGSARRLRFRISDYVDRSPEGVLVSLAWYLLCRASGVECPAGEDTRYHDYAWSRELWEPKRETYFQRAKNLNFHSVGKVRDLSHVFEYVNSFYFAGKLRRPALAWSSESPSTRLGFYFQPLDLLAANRALDSERVPRYVLEFVVYHEILHGVRRPLPGTRRRVHHDREFKLREREFTMYSEAEKWLSEIAWASKNK